MIEKKDLMKKHDYYWEKLREIQSIKIRATDINKKECLRCGSCCWAMPCDLTEEDIYKIAEFLKIKPKDFFNQYLTIHPYQNNKFTIISIRKGQEKIAGKIKPPENWFDIDFPCIFLNSDNSCHIQKVIPNGAEKAVCWKDGGIKEKAIFHTKIEIQRIYNKLNIGFAIWH